MVWNCNSSVTKSVAMCFCIFMSNYDSLLSFKILTSCVCMNACELYCVVYLHTYMWVHASVYPSMEAIGYVWISYSVILHLIPLSCGLYMNMKTRKPCDLIISASHSYSCVCAHAWFFYVNAGDLNSEPDACMENTPTQWAIISLAPVPFVLKLGVSCSHHATSPSHLLGFRQ